MARASLITTNLSGGELSPEIALGRVDIAKYNNGARRIENCLLTVQGGAKRRPGTRFIATEDGTAVRLVDFVTNRRVAYVIAMVGKTGNNRLHFYKNGARIGGGTPVEAPMPYTPADVFEVNYVQKADTCFFVHEQYPPQRLQRFGDISWGCGDAPFITQPFEEQGHYPAAILSLTSAGPGAATANASANVFLESDIGRTISVDGGTALITSFTSNTQVGVQISAAFLSTSFLPLAWHLEGSPQDAIAPSSEGIVGKEISLNANFTYFGTLQNISAIVSGVGSSSVQTAGAHGYVDGQTVDIKGNFAEGTHVVQVLDATHFAFPSSYIPGQLAATGTVQQVIASTDSFVWRPEDVGKVVSINGGLARITAVINNSTANAIVLREFKSKVPAGANEWQLMSNAWNGIKGYPRAVTINKQRLLFAGSPGYPQHLWASEVQAYLDFRFGTADDEAFRFELDGPRNSPILHLAPAKQLLVLTEADEMSVKGGQEKPITPTNIAKTDESTVGANFVRPVKVGNEIIFVQSAGKKICGAGYRFDLDGFVSPDRTVFASHITGSGVTQLAHQKEPNSTLYAVRADGVMAVAAYDVEQEVTGWTRWITQGNFASVASVPTADAEAVYVVVERELWNGSAFVTQRCVEIMDPDMLVDCGVAGTSVGGQSVWAGLDHLEGKLVQCWADGAYLGEFTVASGAITLPHNVFSVQIGLGFTCAIELLQPEIGGNGQTAQGSQVHVNEVIIRVLDTSAAVINGVNVEFRTFGDALLDQPPPSFTGDVRKTVLQDAIYKTNVTITQPYPLPFHLLDVIRRVTINGD